MRKTGILLVLLSLVIGVNTYAQDDTIGFWQVQYNGKEIGSVTFDNEPTYFLDSIADSAKINVYYYTESPCSKCLCRLEVRDANSKELKKIERKGYGDNTPFRFSGAEIKKMLASGKIYLYFTGKYDGWLSPVLLGAIRKRE